MIDERLMTMVDELHAVETGDATPAEARQLIEGLDDTVDMGGEVALEVAGQTYASFRRAIGRILKGALPAEELREWHDVVRVAAGRFAFVGESWAVRLEVLCELLDDRAGIAEARPIETTLRRRHVAEFLTTLAEAPGASLARTDLGEKLDLRQANLSRVVTFLVDSELVSRRASGREATLELTASGRRAVDRLVKETSSTTPQEGECAPDLFNPATAANCWDYVSDDAAANDDLPSAWLREERPFGYSGMAGPAEKNVIYELLAA